MGYVIPLCPLCPLSGSPPNWMCLGKHWYIQEVFLKRNYTKFPSVGEYYFTCEHSCIKPFLCLQREFCAIQETVSNKFLVAYIHVVQSSITDSPLVRTAMEVRCMANQAAGKDSGSGKPNPGCENNLKSNCRRFVTRVWRICVQEKDSTFSKHLSSTKYKERWVRRWPETEMTHRSSVFCRETAWPVYWTSIGVSIAKAPRKTSLQTQPRLWEYRKHAYFWKARVRCFVLEIFLLLNLMLKVIESASTFLCWNHSRTLTCEQKQEAWSI